MLVTSEYVSFYFIMENKIYPFLSSIIFRKLSTLLNLAVFMSGCQVCQEFPVTKGLEHSAWCGSIPVRHSNFILYSEMNFFSSFDLFHKPGSQAIKIGLFILYM